MKYAFKMMAVVMALGVLVLGGVSIASADANCNIESVEGFKKLVCKKNINDESYYDFLSTPEQFRYLCRAIFKGNWSHRPDWMFRFQIAQRNGLRCEGITSSDIKKKNNELIKIMPYEMKAYLPYWDSMEPVKYATNLDVTEPVNSKKPSNRALASISDSTVCYNATTTSNGTKVWNDRNKNFVDEAKFRGLDCDFKDNKTVIASKPKTKTYTQPKSTISSAELNASKREAETERTKRLELERKLASLENKQKQGQQRIDTDTRVPLLEIISNKTKGKRGTITGIARDNIEVAEVTVDGQAVQLSSNGNFKYSTFVPSDGITLNVQVTDVAGLTSSRLVALQRNDSIASTSITFDRLNPLGKSVRINSNALALIVGVEGYKNTNADALYADKDAKMFRDFASEKIGIPENRIKILLNDNAGRIDITRAIKTWLLKRTVTDKTDIYVFFAGHGLATDDGKGMYLLPYDGVPDLLEDSAIQRKQLFADIKATKPRSVTVFLDTCYSGGTRNEEETLVASLRPIIITAKQQSIPDNFTVLSAAKGNQTSQSLEEAKHGLFSYYMMLGMEGGADLNADNKITARELHEYVVDKVERQSQFRQTPELQGDKDRVLVQFN
ncbi:caspase family protein [bacterium]|nr:caspase family protein [bacterium]